MREQAHAQEDEQKDKRKNTTTVMVVVRAFGLATMIGLVGIIVFGLQFGAAISETKNPTMGSVVSVGTLLAGASLLIGALLGFLFGIPRTLQGDRPLANTNGQAGGNSAEGNGTESRANGNTGTDNNEGSAVSYGINTNLEQISDWLTKILVGVGLTQIGEIPTALETLARYISPALGNTNTSGIFGLTVFLYYLVCGFLFGYVMTRIYLTGAFREAETVALTNRINEVEKRTKRTEKELLEVKKQEHANELALILANRQLTESGSAESISQKELDDAITQASSDTRAQIFNQAFTLRQAEWKGNPEKMERTIRLFRALVASNPGNYNYRAQLGYTLKDQRVPDWPQAEAELNEAIKLRGEPTDLGSLYYELNRALCRIAQDPARQSGGQAAPELRKNVIDDLRAAARNPRIRVKIQGASTSDHQADQMLWTWLQQNQITLDILF